MLGTILNNPFSFVILFVALISAVIIHEVAHGFVADRLGDPTARLMGRLTLNPLPHIDPIGSILVPLLLLISQTGFMIGWAKPVPFDTYNLRNPRRDAALISLAGPGANLLLAALASILLRGSIAFGIIEGGIGIVLEAMFLSVIVTNVQLAIFNLVPIAPLDGFKIVGGFLSESAAREWYTLERYGVIFLILMTFPLFGGPAPITTVMRPIMNFLFSLFVPGSGSTGVI